MRVQAARSPCAAEGRKPESHHPPQRPHLATTVPVVS